jgi:hypothetical protein
MSLPPGVLAVVVDLYDTLVYVALPPKDEQLTTLLGVSQNVLARAFAATGPTRWAGAGRHASPPPGADAVIHGLRELL